MSKSGKDSINFNVFCDRWTTAFQKTSPPKTEDVVFLLYSTAKSFFSHASQKQFTFNPISDKYKARTYFNEQLKSFENSLTTADPSSFTLQSIVMLIKTYNMMQIHPSSAMQNLLIEQSLSELGSLCFRDQRYILRNLVGIGIYPGDEWIKAWHSAFTDNHSGNKVYTRDDLSDALYYTTIMDDMRTQQGPHQDPISPARQIATGMLDQLQDSNNCLERVVSSAIYYPARYYGYEFVAQTRLRDDHKVSLKENFWFRKTVEAQKRATFPDELSTPDNTPLTQVFCMKAQGVSHPVIYRLDGRPSFITDISGDKAFYAPQIAFEKAVLSSLNPEKIMVSIPYTLLSRVLGLSTDIWMTTLFNNLKKIDPGHYVLHPDKIYAAQENGAWEFHVPKPDVK